MRGNTNLRSFSSRRRSTLEAAPVATALKMSMASRAERTQTLVSVGVWRIAGDVDDGGGVDGRQRRRGGEEERAWLRPGLDVEHGQVGSRNKRKRPGLGRLEARFAGARARSVPHFNRLA
jgi:hypothetical protein